MFCKYCGNQIPEKSAFCPICGKKVGDTNGNRELTPSQISQNTIGKTSEEIAANQLFVQFAREKNNTGLRCELILWCIVCASVLLLGVQILLTLVGTNYWSGRISGVRGLWFILFLFSIGLGVLMELRWKGVSILYGNIVILGIILIPYYIKGVNIVYYSIGEEAAFLFTACFCLAWITILGLIVCSILEFVTKINMKLPVMICSIVAGAFILCMIAIACLTFTASGYGASDFGNKYFLTGSAAYLCVCSAVLLYTIFFCKGLIDNTNAKFVRSAILEADIGADKKRDMQQKMVGIQCICGSYQGQAFSVQGEIIIGSQPGSAHVVVQDAYVSRQHCSIRFNTASGNYEVRDLSANGVFLENGMRLQNGVYHSCPRGTVLYLGSRNQQFRLM